MMTFRRTRFWTIFIFVMSMVAACVEPFPPPSSSADANFLVVEGFINASDRTATVKLFHSVPLAASEPVPPEENATVIVESSAGDKTSLTEDTKGIYTATNMAIDPSKTYRVTIGTTAGKSYSSDYITIRPSAIMDSISWRGEAAGTRFYVSSHDPENATHYYRYLVNETWEYRVQYVSDFKRDGDVPVFRPSSEQIYTCWQSSQATDILTVTTSALAEDRVSMYPINLVAKGSRMLSRTYSINVQQRGISAEEYEYWNLVRKTTESLGGLFDPLPSQVTGNVHNDNDGDEHVLGYVSGGFVQEQRIFVKFQDLPVDLQVVDGWGFECPIKTVPVDQFNLVGDYVYLQSIGIPPVAYTATISICSDCRTIGGKNVKPSFWPQ